MRDLSFIQCRERLLTCSTISDQAPKLILPKQKANSKNTQKEAPLEIVMEDDVSQEIDEEGALQQHAKERQKTRNKQVKHMRKESKKLAKQKAEKILEAEEETSNQLKEDSHAAAEVRLKKEKVAAEQDEHERAKKTLEAETRKKISDVEVKARDKKFAIQTKSRRTRSDVSMEERQSLGDWKRWTITTLLSTLIRDA